MSERRNADGSLSVGCLEDMKPVEKPVETVEKPVEEKPKKKTTKKK